MNLSYEEKRKLELLNCLVVMPNRTVDETILMEDLADALPKECWDEKGKLNPAPLPYTTPKYQELFDRAKRGDK